MEVRPLKLKGTYEIVLTPHVDARGHFMRVYDSARFKEAGMQTQWMQENESRTVKRFTVRGLHFQVEPFAETKLVRVAHGAVLDVFVDLRRESSTMSQWDSIVLSADKYNMAYIPRGFAHGFCYLTDEVIMLYKVDNVYSPGHERTLRWNDPELRISWPTDDPLVSDKDRRAKSFAELKAEWMS
jgi:dTDP-4-dehydrorhamnose 3,5-epimerase